MTDTSLIELRRAIHRYPELSGKEKKTAETITAYLKKLGPVEIRTGIGGHGVAAVYDRGGSTTVLVRCELDALPIREINDFDHASGRPGISHKCGHDGHMAILCGLAERIHNDKELEGTVILLFQPAEETGEGAKAVLDDPGFKGLEPDYALSLHNIPGEPMHTVICKAGLFTAAVKSIIVQLTGKESHAGEPGKGINPALAIADIIRMADGLNRPKEHADFILITPIQIEMGEEAYGTSAGSGTVRFTIRTWSGDNMTDLCRDMEERIKQISDTYGLKVEISYTQEFFANYNDADIVDKIRYSASLFNYPILEMDEPFSWGEDFGLFTKAFTGAMFGLGSGKDTPALHNPDYDFPDELIETGVNVFKTTINQLLKQK